MPPLNRQDSRPSIHSWWSDSNSLLVYGPSMNLHTAAKPLMRLMYHRQASDILRKNRGSPLTTAILETYASYFPWDYVSWATKAAILSDLADRTESSEVEARAVVNSPLVGRIATHEATAPAVLQLKPCEQIVSLLGDEDSLVPYVTYALSQITYWVDGAKAVVDAKALNHVLRLLESSNPDSRKWACELTGHLALHESTAPTILELKPCEQIVSLLGDEDSLVPYVTYALSQIARWVDGAKAVVDAKALNHVLRLLESSNPDSRRWACELTGYLALHESTAPTILELKPCEQIVSLLGDEDSLVPYVTYALSQIAYWVDGAKAVVDAKAPNHVLRLLESPNPDTRGWACVLTGHLALHKSTAPTILQLKPCEQIVSLLGDEDHVVRWATYALSQIARWVDGAKTVVDAKVLDYVLKLLESPNPDTRGRLTGNLALYESTAPAILNIPAQLVSPLADEHSMVYQTTYTLSQIAQRRNGTTGVVDAKVLDHVLPLLESPDPDTRGWACVLVQGLASHEATAPAILELKPIPQLESLLQDLHPSIRDSAISALEAIRQWPDGADVAAPTDSDGALRA
ncbi:armadillo-type protein [Mycena olivaceomarginata]|nr:armadillo-type protein [Mycena olivaceomarginata]